MEKYIVEILSSHRREVLIVLLFVIVVIWLISRLTNKEDKWVSKEKFQREKKKLHPHFSEEEFRRFCAFLKSYQGGYVRRRSGKIVYQDFLNKEKGDLKGIFFNLVIANPNITVAQKEEFRHFLISIGVTGVDERPGYETRDSKLRNRKTDEDDYWRKKVGNTGKQIVRDELKKLDQKNYAVINGPALKYGGQVKEFDHIVVGKTGVFCIETKAFGMTDGKNTKSMIRIDGKDNWMLQRGNYGKNIGAPTKQIREETQVLENVIQEDVAEVHPVLVLSNRGIQVRSKYKLPYDVVRVDGIVDYITKYKGFVLEESERKFILSDIERCRVN